MSLACVFSLVASISYLIEGRRATAQIGLQLWEVIVLYFGGGIVGGLLAGGLSGVVRNSLSAAVVGWLAVLPTALAYFIATMPRSEWFPPGVVMAVFCSAIFGGGLAAVGYSKQED